MRGNSIINERRDHANFQLIIITHDENFLRKLGQSNVMEYYWYACTDVSPLRSTDGRQARLEGLEAEVDNRKTSVRLVSGSTSAAESFAVYSCCDVSLLRRCLPLLSVLLLSCTGIHVLDVICVLV
ncbi:hypothetical protein OH77DRAFT_378772 [Trametes cingulata]|nr:hypothetical protein OH77DRAFT_378772 [Trametes cingulata]